MLLDKWTPELVNEVLNELTEMERSALALDQERPNKGIGEKSLTKYGFACLSQYIVCLYSGKLKAREYLKRMYDIESISALDFEQPQCSSEGRLLQKVRKATA